MTTDTFDPDSSVECAMRDKLKTEKLQLHRQFIYDILVCLGLIAYFATMFFVVKLCLEMSLRAVAHEIAVYVRIPVGM